MPDKIAETNMTVAVKNDCSFRRMAQHRQAVPIGTLVTE